MVDIERGADSEGFRQTAKHTLFVEGSNDDAIDPEVLTLLLKNIPVQIKAMGPSSYIRSVAEALHSHHPYYYFLVDRDHYNQQVVERCWQSFPHPDTCNLLIWRRKELENYFLTPEYISKSLYCRCSEEDLRAFILQEARKRVFLDVANLVIISLREELKKKWIEVFADIQHFSSKDEALKQLLARETFSQHISDVANKLHKNEITRRFEAIVNEFFGDQAELEYSHGLWLEMISGKAILKAIVNRCFRVTSQGQRKTLQGNEALKAVVKDLLIRLPLVEQPTDFQELYKLIHERTR